MSRSSSPPPSSSSILFDNEIFNIPIESAIQRSFCNKLVKTIILLIFSPVILIGLFLLTLLSLIIGKPFTSQLSAYMVPYIMEQVDSDLFQIRKELLKNIKGKVLDVGCADGRYLHYYASNSNQLTQVTMLEPNIKHYKQLRSRIERFRSIYTHLQNVKFVIESSFIENIPDTENNSYDWIILGNVLCEVPNPQSILNNINRLLNKNGRIYFCEHIAHSHGTWYRKIQNIINPWWTIISDGCNVNRCTLDLIMQQQNWNVCYWSYYTSSMLMPMKVGLAKKNCEIVT